MAINQERIRGQRCRPPVQRLGYVNSGAHGLLVNFTEVIFRRHENASPFSEMSVNVSGCLYRVFQKFVPICFLLTFHYLFKLPL